MVDALQLSARASVATPANWPNNHENIGAKGWAFLLPTVTPEDATAYFPNAKVRHQASVDVQNARESTRGSVVVPK